MGRPKRSPAQSRACSVRAGSRSVSRDDRAAELVVHADAKDVVGDVRIVAQRRKGAAWRDDRRYEGARNASKIHVEIFELRGPIAADDAFDAGSHGPSNPGRTVAERGRERYERRSTIHALRAHNVGAADGVSCLDIAIGQAAGGIKQNGGRDGPAEAPAHRAEPIELFNEVTRYREARDVEWGRISDVPHGASAV